jgi:hypothetical protein
MLSTLFKFFSEFLHLSMVSFLDVRDFFIIRFLECFNFRLENSEMDWLLVDGYRCSPRSSFRLRAPRDTLESRCPIALVPLACVPHLLNTVRPPAIAWFVVAVRIPPIEFKFWVVSVRQCPVLKRLEVVAPFLANTDSPRAVVEKRLRGFAVAPCLHVAPNAVKTRFRLAMRLESRRDLCCGAFHAAIPFRSLPNVTWINAKRFPANRTLDELRIARELLDWLAASAEIVGKRDCLFARDADLTRGFISRNR